MSPEAVLLILRVLLALVLYAFFGYALLLVWRSFPRTGPAEQITPALYATEYVEAQLINTHQLRQVNLIGRAADNTVVLSDELVSAHHARLSFTGGQWLLEDLGSRNGTFVNEVPLESPLAVAPGDHILIGATRFELVEALPGEERTTPA